MQISFSPIRAQGALSVSVAGEVLTVGGQRFDLGPLQEGDRLPAAAFPSPAIAGDVTRVGGTLHIPLLLPHGEDALPEVRFPAPVTLVDGPCAAPGLVPHDGPVTDGLIDWSKRLTPAAVIAAARAEWRATRVVSKLDVMLALLTMGIISEASAMSPGIPAEFAPVIDDMPPPLRNEMRIRWAHLIEVSRMHPLILQLKDKLEWTDEQADALFGWVG